MDLCRAEQKQYMLLTVHVPSNACPMGVTMVYELLTIHQGALQASVLAALAINAKRNGASGVHLEIVRPVGQQDKGRADTAAEHQLMRALAKVRISVSNSRALRYRASLHYRLSHILLHCAHSLCSVREHALMRRYTPSGAAGKGPMQLLLAMDKEETALLARAPLWCHGLTRLAAVSIAGVRHTSSNFMRDCLT